MGLKLTRTCGLRGAGRSAIGGSIGCLRLRIASGQNVEADVDGDRWRKRSESPTPIDAKVIVAD